MLDPIYITFLIVAETGSFSKTGKKLYISAVSVRKQITKIENEIGIKLFIRGSQGVQLTKAGQLLYEKTIKIKEQADKTMEEVKSIVIQVKIVINVGASMMRPATRLTELWKKAGDALSDYTLHITPLDDNNFNAKSLKSMIGNEIDCITIPYDAQMWYDNFNILKLGEDVFKLAVPFSNPLSEKSFLKLSELSGQTIVTPSRESPSVFQICRMLEKEYPDIYLKSLPTLYTSNTFYNHPNNIILTSDSFRSISPTFNTIDVDWDFVSPTGIVYSMKPSEKMNKFIKLLNEVLQNNTE